MKKKIILYLKNFREGKTSLTSSEIADLIISEMSGKDGDKLTIKYLKSKGYTMEEREDRDGDKFITWWIDGFDIYQDEDEEIFCFCTRYRDETGGFKSGIIVDTIQRLELLSLAFNHKIK